MLELALRIALGGVLVWAAVRKAAAPSASASALAGFGLPAGRIREVALWALVATELVLAAGVLVGSTAAAVVAAALMLAFSGAMVTAILGGRSGAPCSCFGARSRIGWPAVLRNLAFAAGFLAIPLVPDPELSREGWLAVGLVAAWAALLGLGVAVLALAREIGVLRLQLGPQRALEIQGEGPEIGSPAPGLIGLTAPGPASRLALAIFLSESCGMCERLRPQIEMLAREPAIAVAIVEERLDPDTWREHEIPGSPFAVALDTDGTVLAKGTFNNLAQLESLLSTAEARQADPLAVAGA